MSHYDNRESGVSFEKLFEKHCQLAGLWAEKNHLKAQLGWKGRLQALPSNLDYVVIQRGGKICYVDCKSFDRTYFTFSKIPEHQLSLAQRYNEHGISAGFVVWFRPVNLVSFFPGWLIGARGAGTRFLPQDGRQLGSWERFDPARVFDSAKGSTSGSLGG